MKEILEAIALAEGWTFEYARRDYQNLYDELEVGQICLFLDPVIQDINFGEYNEEESRVESGAFLLLTASDVDDETYNQKYIDHIKPMLDTHLKTIQGTLACNDTITLNTWNLTEVINLFDYNLDGIIVNFNVTIDV